MNEKLNNVIEEADSLEKILTEYRGRLSEVPDARLERLGFMAVRTGTLTEIMKISEYEASKHANEAKQQELIKKPESIPFDIIDLEFESESRTGLIDHLDFNILYRTIDSNEVLLDGRDEFLYGNKPSEMNELVNGAGDKVNKIYELAQKLANQGRIPLLANVEDPQFAIESLFADIYCYSLSESLIKHEYHEAILQLKSLIDQLDVVVYKHQNEDNDYSSDINAIGEKIDQKIQYLSGKYGDPNLYSSELIKQLNERCNYGDWWSEGAEYDSPISCLTLIKNIIEVILRDIESTELVESIKNAESLEDLQGKINTIAPITARQAELQTGIKNKTLDPREVSGELAKLKADRKETQAILESINELTLIPEKQADMVRKRIDQLRSKIFRGNDKMRKNFFTFDARPDEKLDKDPGSVSGDCTAGRPLPFNLRPDLFNVKVRDSRNEHVGNIYLLKTRLFYNKSEEVWHLDAIQIISGARWNDEAIQKFFDTLNEAAEKKGVKGITVNTVMDKISNHRSISQSFLAWLENNPEVVQTVILVPDVTFSDHVSTFQSDGTVFFVPNKTYSPKK